MVVVVAVVTVAEPVLEIIVVDAVFAPGESEVPLVWLGNVLNVPTAPLEPLVELATVLDEAAVAETVGPLMVDNEEATDETIDSWVPAKQNSAWWCLHI